MKQAITDVLIFHQKFDIPIELNPSWPKRKRVEWREDMLREEYIELLTAIAERNMVMTADGIADMIYVLIGTALEFGIPLNEIWNAVQTSNIAKADPITGKIRKRSDGKILKPEGWKKPNIKEILLQAGYKERYDNLAA